MVLMLSLFLGFLITLVLSILLSETSTELPESILIPVRISENEPFFRSRR